MKFYKRLNGKWRVGDANIPSGTCIEVVNDQTGKFTIQDFDGSVYASNILATDFEKENGDKYASVEEYEEATADFFVKAPTYGGNPLLPYYVDIDFPIIIRETGPNIPTLEVLKGNITAPQWQVNDYNVCEGQELIHGWKEGSQVNWHIHIVTNGTNTSDRFVKFEIEQCHATHLGVLSAIETISHEFSIPANTPDRTMIIVSLGAFTYTDGKIGSHIWARLKRVVSTGSAPTANPFCTMLQAHVICDSLGSEFISVK